MAANDANDAVRKLTASYELSSAMPSSQMSMLRKPRER